MWVLLIMILLLVALHRPLLRFAVDKTGRYYAAKEGYTVDWEIAGSGLWDVEIKNLVLTGSPDDPLRRMKWRTASADFSPWTLITKGFADGLQRVALEDASIEVDTRIPAKIRPDSDQQKLWLKDINFRNVDVRIITPGGDITLRGLTLFLSDTKPGTVKIADITAPAQSLHFSEVHGVTEIKNGTAHLTNLVLAPDLEVPRLAVNFEKLNKGLLPFEISVQSGVATVESKGRWERGSVDMMLAVKDLAHAKLMHWVKLPEGVAGNVESASAHIQGPLAEPHKLTASGVFAVTDFQVEGVRGERAEGNASFANDVVRITAMEVRLDAKNRAAVTGEMNLAGRQPAAISWDASIGSLTTLLPTLGGSLVTKGDARFDVADLRERKYTRGTASGTARVESLVWEERRFEFADVEFTYRDARLDVPKLDARLNALNTLTASGHVMLDASGEFDALANGNFEALADFSDWMALAKLPRIASGKATVSWKGSGKLAERTINGEGSLSVVDLKLEGWNDAVSVALETRHTGQRAEIAKLVATAGAFRAEGAMTVTETDLSIPQFVLFSDQTRLVTGSAEIPLALSQKSPVDPTRPLKAQLHMEKMDLEKLYAVVGQKPPVSGAAAMDLDLSGTLNAPTGKLTATLSDVKVNEKLGPALVKVNATLARQVLTVDAVATQKPFQPITAHAELPFDAAAIIATPTSLLDVPIVARLVLPNSSLAEVSRYFPDVTSISGTASADVKLSGTLRKPEWKGALIADASRMALKGADMDIRAMKVRASFIGQRLTLDDVSATVSGGQVRVGGTVDLTELVDPKLNLRVDVKEALVVRDDTMSMRADGRLTCIGTLVKADVAGRIELVRGRVFREIEFLPLSLPNQLPPAPTPVRLTTVAPTAPAMFAQWTFNVDIVTRDPIRLLGNVLNGGAAVNLHASGTGAAPILEGKISQQDARVRLPFSRLTLTRGDVIFTKENPFNPQIDLQGESVVGNYQVNVFATGSALKPTLRFTSSPPLSEPQIATLLATGTAEGDAQSAGGVAANRAAFLVLSRVYRKVFDKAAPSRKDDEPGRASFSFNPLGESLSRPSVSATYEISPRWQAEASLGERGFRGLFRYLVRLR